MTATPAAALLRVRDLKTYFVTEHGRGTARAVDEVSFDLYPGETLGIVGESGCGKTVTSLSILRLVPEPPGHILPGSLIEFEGLPHRVQKIREIEGVSFYDDSKGTNVGATVAALNGLRQ